MSVIVFSCPVIPYHRAPQSLSAHGRVYQPRRYPSVGAADHHLVRGGQGWTGPLGPRSRRIDCMIANVVVLV
jgi:hypothetical protein